MLRLPQPSRPRFPTLSIIFLFLISSITPATCYTCYAPDGLPVDGNIIESHQPCKAPGLSTICCATSRSNPPGGNSSLGQTADECLSNGLCQNRMTTNGVETTTYWANYCTDQNFNGGNCLSICPQTRGTAKNTQVTPCNNHADSERWCCGADNTACCETGAGAVTLPRNFTGIARALGSSSSSTVTSAATRSVGVGAASTRSVSASSSSTDMGKEKGETPSVPGSGGKERLESGAIAGIVIGILASFILLGTTIFFATRRSKTKILKHSEQGHHHHQGNFSGSGTSTPLFGQQQGYENRSWNELSQENEKYELGQERVWSYQGGEGQHTPHELPTGLHPGFIRVPEMTLTTPRGTSGHMFRSPI